MWEGDVMTGLNWIGAVEIDRWVYAYLDRCSGTFIFYHGVVTN